MLGLFPGSEISPDESGPLYPIPPRNIFVVNILKDGLFTPRKGASFST